MGFEERRIGTVIGKWRVDSLLGSGSMAAVYAVTHRNGSRAALKILHAQLCNDELVVERFLSEGYLANVVKHPGIVRVFDDGMTDEGCPFLAMEMLEGETLDDYCEAKGPKIPLNTALGIADSIMDVLAAVHAGNVIHRNLKPSNVFLTTELQIKLLDFGVAKLSDKKSVSKLSLVGMVLGTPSFMAPEQARGARDEVDARSDIFALGAILFTMLTGENVHPVEGVQQKLVAAATQRARSISLVLPSVPPPIAAVIDQALQFRKDDRWQTVTQMRRALKEAAEGLVNETLRPPPPSTARISVGSNGGGLGDDEATEAMAPLATPSGRRLSAPPVTDSGRVGFFFDEHKSSTSLEPAPSSAPRLHGDPLSAGAPAHGDYGALTAPPPKRSRVPVALAVLAALLALAAATGVYFRASLRVADPPDPSPIPSPAPPAPSASAEPPTLAPTPAPVDTPGTAAPSASSAGFIPTISPDSLKPAPKPQTFMPPQVVKPAVAPPPTAELPSGPTPTPAPAPAPAPTPADKPDLELLQ